ncbi:MAG: hypothetical protein E7214_13645 [Clostridium sp.]|nr:hypothetical protein [Clostridium sp.]
MIKLVEKYVNSIRRNKLNGIIFSVIFAFFIFITTHIYNITFKDMPADISFVVTGISSTILGVIWFFCSLSFVKVADKIEEKKKREKEKERQAKRNKAMYKKRKKN